MRVSLYYEDVEVGMELPTLVKETSIIAMAKWAGGSGDYDPMHYDKLSGEAQGFPDAIVQGKLKAGYLVQLVTDWIGPEGWLKKFSCQYRRTDPVRDKMIMKGRVTKKYVQGEEHIVECEIWAETPQGEKTTPGSAIVILPSKSI